MPRLHALELTPDSAGDLVVRRDWEALHEGGLPSQLDHRGSTNAPHLTVASARHFDDEQLAAAVDVLGSLLPLRARVSGLTLLGGERVTLVRLLDVTHAVTSAVLALRARTEPRHSGWLPHVTLARRLPRADVARALQVLGHADEELTFTALRRWDPEHGTVRVLAGDPDVTGVDTHGDVAHGDASGWSATP